MKIAIASSGLGHVARGIETWAADLAYELTRHAARIPADRDIDVTLFAAARPAAPPAQPATCNLQPATQIISCFKRGGRAARLCARLTPACLWRWGLKTTYGWEQFTFWLHLWPRLKRGPYDILHVQDPMLAFWCRAWRRRGWLATREILAHGTEEPAVFLRQFEYLQHLAPWHQEARKNQPHNPMHTVIPNFVDVDRFRPASDTQRQAARSRFGMPKNAIVFGEVAAVKSHHKRIDWLIRTFAAYSHDQIAAENPVVLAVAGARTPESEALVALAGSLAPERVLFFFDLTFREMPAFYRALDVFVHAALFEMMPIAVLEAMASGLPVLHHDHPVMNWMAGEGGMAIDLRRETALNEVLSRLIADPAARRRLARAARVEAETRFSKQIVIPQIPDYYRAVGDGNTMAHGTRPLATGIDRHRPERRARPG